MVGYNTATLAPPRVDGIFARRTFWWSNKLKVGEKEWHQCPEPEFVFFICTRRMWVLLPWNLKNSYAQKVYNKLVDSRYKNFSKWEKWQSSSPYDHRMVFLLLWNLSLFRMRSQRYFSVTNSFVFSLLFLVRVYDSYSFDSISKSTNKKNTNPLQSPRSLTAALFSKV